MYIYYQRYEARDQVSARSRRTRPKRIVQRISHWRRARKRRRGYFAELLGRLIGTAETGGLAELRLLRTRLVSPGAFSAT